MAFPRFVNQMAPEEMVPEDKINAHHTHTDLGPTLTPLVTCLPFYNYQNRIRITVKPKFRMDDKQKMAQNSESLCGKIARRPINKSKIAAKKKTNNQAPRSPSSQRAAARSHVCDTDVVHASLARSTKQATAQQL